MTTTTAKKAADPASPTDHENLASALAAFQAEMPTVHKGKTARIPGKNGGAGYSYEYADLADVAKVAHPILSRHGLAFHTAPTHLEGVGFVLQGILRHTSGETETGALPITGRSAQDLGSSLTYLRRYLLGCMTGIVTDDDEDGALATQAGAERPQADTPPTYAPPPESQEPPPTPEWVANLRARLGTLDERATHEVQTWWAQQQLPALAAMNQFEASGVMSYLDERDQQAAQDPR